MSRLHFCCRSASSMRRASASAGSGPAAPRWSFMKLGWWLRSASALNVQSTHIFNFNNARWVKLGIDTINNSDLFPSGVIHDLVCCSWTFVQDNSSSGSRTSSLWTTNLLPDVLCVYCGIQGVKNDSNTHKTAALLGSIISIHTSFLFRRKSMFPHDTFVLDRWGHYH